jgi:alpha-D-ribose 1-methylphosphonate 5-triphosphate diphosphatase PhnM
MGLWAHAAALAQLGLSADNPAPNAIRGLARSHRWPQVGSYINGGANFDIKAGDYYPVNLLTTPFNLRPAPLEVINEKSSDGKHMLLFDLQALQWDDDLTGI